MSQGEGESPGKEGRGRRGPAFIVWVVRSYLRILGMEVTGNF